MQSIMYCYRTGRNVRFSGGSAGLGRSLLRKKSAHPPLKWKGGIPRIMSSHENGLKKGHLLLHDTQAPTSVLHLTCLTEYDASR